MLWSFHVVFQRHHLLHTDRINAMKPLNTERSPKLTLCTPFGGVRNSERIQFLVGESKCISYVNITYKFIQYNYHVPIDLY